MPNREVRAAGTCQYRHSWCEKGPKGGTCISGERPCQTPTSHPLTDQGSCRRQSDFYRRLSNAKVGQPTEHDQGGPAQDDGGRGFAARDLVEDLGVG